ncbi:MAG: hypothetical protein M3Y55_09395 [Pseudomonadota bacterium]|nr:hypothetical protein [Pseudomonadota bacterium]
MVRSDRPIVGCVGDQNKLNPDGSKKGVVPRQQTEEERAADEAKTRAEEGARAERQANARRDRNLLIRFPDKARHDQARKEALDSANAAVHLSNARIAELERARKPLMEEAEFYKGKPLPSKTKSALDANDAALAAQKALIQNQQGEVDRIDKLYDEQLEKLRKLWAAKSAPPA